VLGADIKVEDAPEFDTKLLEMRVVSEAEESEVNKKAGVVDAKSLVSGNDVKTFSKLPYDDRNTFGEFLTEEYSELKNELISFNAVSSEAGEELPLFGEM
jgi:hypothetical protein